MLRVDWLQKKLYIVYVAQLRESRGQASRRRYDTPHFETPGSMTSESVFRSRRCYEGGWHVARTEIYLLTSDMVQCRYHSPNTTELLHPGPATHATALA